MKKPECSDLGKLRGILYITSTDYILDEVQGEEPICIFLSNMYNCAVRMKRKYGKFKR